MFIQSGAEETNFLNDLVAPLTESPDNAVLAMTPWTGRLKSFKLLD